MVETPTFELEEVVALDPTDTTAFTPDHKTFLEEHKDELTTDELVKFGFETNLPKPAEVKPPEKPETPAPAPKPAENEDDDAAKEEARISGMIDKKLTPLQEENRKLQAKVDIDSFISNNPDYGKYRDSITAYKNHPHYANIPVHELAKMVAANDLMKIGARKERAAKKTVDSTRQPGNNGRPAGNAKDWGAASKEDFAAQRAKVLGQA